MKSQSKPITKIITLVKNNAEEYAKREEARKQWKALTGFK